MFLGGSPCWGILINPFSRYILPLQAMNQNKTVSLGIRLGIEKRGDTFALSVGLNGEPMKPVGTTAELHLEGPFYVGIGFCSHQPVTSDTAVLSDVVLKESK